MINKSEYIDSKTLSKNTDNVIFSELEFLSDNLSLEEFKKLRKIESENESYSSKEVEKILYIRDVFKKNWVNIEDFDVFMNILKWLQLWKNLI